MSNLHHGAHDAMQSINQISATLRRCGFVQQAVEASGMTQTLLAAMESATAALLVVAQENFDKMQAAAPNVRATHVAGGIDALHVTFHLVSDPNPRVDFMREELAQILRNAAALPPKAIMAAAIAKHPSVSAAEVAQIAWDRFADMLGCRRDRQSINMGIAAVLGFTDASSALQDDLIHGAVGHAGVTPEAAEQLLALARGLVPSAERVHLSPWHGAIRTSDDRVVALPSPTERRTDVEAFAARHGLDPRRLWELQQLRRKGLPAHGITVPAAQAA